MNDIEVTGSLREQLRTQKHICVTQGYSGVEVYYLPELAAYLKIGETGKVSDLGRERDILNWLEGKFPVPRVLNYDATGETEFLLLSEIAGVPGSDRISADEAIEAMVTDVARSSAAALRRLHEIPINNCPFDMRLDARFARSRKSIDLGLLSETDEEFASEHGGMMPGEVYDDLVARRSDGEDLVFTHGDPCMPNIIVNNGSIAGFIDMDGAGVADRYVDIAIFFRSFRYNSRVPIDLETVFREAYGIDRLDEGKLDYYRLLDDLF